MRGLISLSVWSLNIVATNCCYILSRTSAHDRRNLTSKDAYALSERGWCHYSVGMGRYVLMKAKAYLAVSFAHCPTLVRILLQGNLPYFRHASRNGLVRDNTKKTS
ncbi:hypothetical protein F4782DRAFT_488373 [Xylaria castorea]|nr:hypothetical protein F4782DRAFT_488373 [Xylaria castorea]